MNTPPPFSSRPILSLILILGILTAAISPACKFISGQATTFIEICTAQGLKTVPLPKEQNPADESSETTPPCLFCFASHTFKAVPAHDPALISAQAFHHAFIMPSSRSHLAGDFSILPEARAPPAIA